MIKNLPANAGERGDVGSIPGLGRSPGVGDHNPLQYSPMRTGISGDEVSYIVTLSQMIQNSSHSSKTVILYIFNDFVSPPCFACVAILLMFLTVSSGFSSLFAAP